MIWAKIGNKRVMAYPKAKEAYCEICNSVLIAKCGNIKVWHWAHKNAEDCDSWREEETEWHKKWKNQFPEECQEVKIGKHRADVKYQGLIIEFQHSPISTNQIEEREDFYDNMIWVLHGESLCGGLELRKKEEIYTFRWRHPPKSWWMAKKGILIDLIGKMGCIGKSHNYFTGKFLFLIKKLYKNVPCGGWGKVIAKEDFIKCPSI
jgi:competence CoiA-like predicted nuclease